MQWNWIECVWVFFHLKILFFLFYENLKMNNYKNIIRLFKDGIRKLKNKLHVLTTFLIFYNFTSANDTGLSSHYNKPTD